MDFSGEQVLVTGGLRGIGRATALAFLRHGARVAVFDLDEPEHAAVVDFMRSAGFAGDRVCYRRADVTALASVQTAVDSLASAGFEPSVLVNNAGKGSDPTPIETMPESHWDALVALNLKGAYVCCRCVAGVMKQRGRGRIVNLASTAGRGISENSSVPYAAAKAGIVGFTRQLARELGHFGIRVNAIAPGSILTGRAKERFETAPETAKQKTLSAIPVGRMGEPEDVAGAVLFLASPAADFITGVILDVNGGRSMA